MQLLLNKLPTEEALRGMKKRFPTLDIGVMGTYLRYLRTSACVLNRIETMLAGHGMTPARLPILLLLLKAGEEGIRPSDLADQIGVTRATMTGLLDHLKESGLVAREHDSRDRRALVIKITPTGREMAERIFPIHMRNIETLLRDLNESDHASLRACLAKIQAGLERLEAMHAESEKPGESARNPGGSADVVRPTGQELPID